MSWLRAEPSRSSVSQGRTFVKRSRRSLGTISCPTSAAFSRCGYLERRPLLLCRNSLYQQREGLLETLIPLVCAFVESQSHAAQGGLRNHHRLLPTGAGHEGCIPRNRVGAVAVDPEEP